MGACVELLAEHVKCTDVVVDLLHERGVEIAVVDRADAFLDGGFVGHLVPEVVTGERDEHDY